MPRYLLVKGSRDRVVSSEGVHAVFDGPVDEALEAIGGAGDSLTGIVSAPIVSGMEEGFPQPGSTGSPSIMHAPLRPHR